MATYTAAEIKAYTTVPAVANWTDAKALLFQAMAEQILTSLDLDIGMTGYSNAYAAAVIPIFDWIAGNPLFTRATTRGKQATTYTIDDLPGPVQLLLRPYMQGDKGAMTRAKMHRADIGLR